MRSQLRYSPIHCQVRLSGIVPRAVSDGEAALCGAEGIRTPDLISAIDARSQLRYSPMD